MDSASCHSLKRGELPKTSWNKENVLFWIRSNKSPGKETAVEGGDAEISFRIQE
jgi:hypothetical protein